MTGAALVGCVIGVRIGWAWRASSPGSPVVDRFVHLDDRQLERRAAFCRLLGVSTLTKPESSWRIVSNETPLTPRVSEGRPVVQMVRRLS